MSQSSDSPREASPTTTTTTDNGNGHDSSHGGRKHARGILKRPKSGDSESFLADTEGEASACSSHKYPVL